MKGNQPGLQKEIIQTLTDDKPLDSAYSFDKGHGRHTWWYCDVYDASQSKKVTEWKDLRRFIHIKRFCTDTKTGETCESDRFYISNLFETDAASYNNGVRNHWKIENSLHWVKDVLHNEDKNRIRTGNGPCNIAIMSTFALNKHKLQGEESITDAIAKFRANIELAFR